MATSLKYKPLISILVFFTMGVLLVACDGAQVGEAFKKSIQETQVVQTQEAAATQTRTAEIRDAERGTAQAEEAFQQAFSQQIAALEAQVAGATTISETMTDRCSGDVFISQYYDDELNLNELNGIILRRTPGEAYYTDWSSKVPVNGHTWIRWWCHSTTGNWADPGTWRITGGIVALDCIGDWDQGSVESCRPGGSIDDLGSSARQGWTPERSRCDSDNTQAISARLGRNRLLEIRCLE